MVPGGHILGMAAGMIMASAMVFFYYKPKGWVRRRIKVDADEWEKIKDWPILWHGTSLENAAKIVFTGLRKPGQGGCRIAHGQFGSKTKTTIYLSPALGVSSHPVYSQLFELKKDKLWGQVVLQCKARPNSWQARKDTLGQKHWPKNMQIDPNFTTRQGLEFLVEDPANVIVTGLMFRQLGPDTDASIFGDLAKQVNNSRGKPEYSLTSLLESDFKARNLYCAGA